ncbi:MAG: ParB/RepB/Spo0J family partition protein [Anaerolineales bacterium]|nr:ParB/RepB/Spo0J family partition protein [Anaerolineales bacterium]
MTGDPRKRGLGRGLGALLVNTTGEDNVDALRQVANNVKTLSVTDLLPNPHQQRTQFDAISLEELAASIRTHGVIQPIVVTAAPDRPGAYWIVAGERRWRAAKQAGLESVPVIVREATPQQLMELALVENVQRADLNPLEEAAAYHALIAEYGLTQAEVAERVGKSRPAVANTVRLLQLPLEAQQALTDGRITAGHARALLGLEAPKALLAALARVLQHDLTVRQTEALVKEMLSAPPKPAAPPDPEGKAHDAYLENRFRTAFGTKVSLSRNEDGSGRLVVHFYSDEDLASIYHLIADDDDSL